MVADTIRPEPPERLRAHPQAALVPAPTREEFEALVADIELRGLVTPIEATAARVVLDGHQRLRAARKLGLTTVPVRTVAPADQVAYLLLAALRRRQLSASQRAALALELEEYARTRARARARQRANLRGQPVVATLPPRGERTREAVARLAGVSARTAQDVMTIKDADPALFAEVKADRIPANRAARAIRQTRLRDALRDSPPLPDGLFQVIYADPPWASANPDSDWAPENHYPTMTLEQIKALAVPAADDAVLFLWALGCQLPQALGVIDAWGFRYVAEAVWVKQSIGLGSWVRYRHEPLLIAVRGTIGAPDPGQRFDSVIEAPRRQHSRKPEQVYELIERAYPRCSKLELFARGKARTGWSAWGNQVAP